MATLARSWLMMPVHFAALGTRAKSFRDNPVIGSAKLNRLGLHVARMRLAARMAAWRRERLACLIAEEDVAAFARDGFVVKHDFLPDALFHALRDEVLNRPAPAREMRQGDAVTRRISLSRSFLRERPATATLLADPRWLGLLRYVASSALAPLVYVQSIISHAADGSVDPQTSFHADTFHSTVKAWLFLHDVAEDVGPLLYVPGSHRLTLRRLAWERKTSIEASRSADFETSRGSPRISREELRRLGFQPPIAFVVPRNTLVVADTMGFHARGASVRPSTRVELWAYGRRNPFLPWLGLDPVAFPLIKGSAADISWAVADVAERLGARPNPWRSAGTITPERAWTVFS